MEQCNCTLSVLAFTWRWRIAKLGWIVRPSLSLFCCMSLSGLDCQAVAGTVSRLLSCTATVSHFLGDLHVVLNSAPLSSSLLIARSLASSIHSTSSYFILCLPLMLTISLTRLPQDVQMLPKTPLSLFFAFHPLPSFPAALPIPSHSPPAMHDHPRAHLELSSSRINFSMYLCVAQHKF